MEGLALSRNASTSYRQKLRGTWKKRSDDLALGSADLDYDAGALLELYAQHIGPRNLAALAGRPVNDDFVLIVFNSVPQKEPGSHSEESGEPAECEPKR